MIDDPSEIYDQWFEPSPSSPCSGCSRRDTNCVSSPFYGVGDFDAQAMYLGHDPGGSSSVDEDSDKWYNFNGRRWKDYPGSEEEIDQYSAAETHSQRAFSDLPNSLPKLSEFVDNLEEDNISGYYTNCAKCNEIHSHERNGLENRKELNKSGKKNCISGFLQEEIKNIKPDVVVLAAKGTNHLDQMYDFFGVREKLPSGSDVKDYVWNDQNTDVSKPEDIIPVAYSQKYKSNIIPSYHFAYSGRAVSGYLDGDGSNLYDSNLNPPKTGGQDWYFGIIASVVSSVV